MKSGKIKLIGLFFVAAGILLAAIFAMGKKEEKAVIENSMQIPTQQEKKVELKEEQKTPQISTEKKPIDVAKETIPQKKLFEVPFTSQAPTGNWKEEVFQDGCEEAAALMAMAWVNGVVFGKPEEVEREIREITDFEHKLLGNVIDISTKDLADVMRKYYKHEKIENKESITSENIKTELAKGNLVLVPAFGQALGNPNYTSPGPIAHMLVIVGYDDLTGEFIANDPGTKRGKNFHYGQKLLFEAIWNYPTARQHAEIPSAETRSKTMIVVGK